MNRFSAKRFRYQGMSIAPCTSIVTDSIVRKLLGATPETVTTATIGFQRDFQLELRRCGKHVYGGYGQDLAHQRRWEPTGGAVLSARIPAPKYNPRASSVYQTSLRPGWDDDDLYRAVCRANGWCRKMVSLHSLRDEVYDLSESRNIDHKELDKVEAERGKDSSYDTMTEEDCIFWADWLRKLPMRISESKEQRPRVNATNKPNQTEK